MVKEVAHSRCKHTAGCKIHWNMIWFLKGLQWMEFVGKNEPDRVKEFEYVKSQPFQVLDKFIMLIFKKLYIWNKVLNNNIYL